MLAIRAGARFETCPYKTMLSIERIFQKAKLLRDIEPPVCRLFYQILCNL